MSCVGLKLLEFKVECGNRLQNVMQPSPNCLVVKLRSYAVQGKIGGVWAGYARPNTPHPPTNCVSPLNY